jgi:glutaminyl-peptide cyclotransferase
VLVELARILAQSPTAPNVGIDIVFFDGEEGDVLQGADYQHWQPLGSEHFASHMSEIYGDRKPTSAIVLDMVCDKHLSIQKEASSVAAASAEVEAFWAVAQKINLRAFSDTIGPAIEDDHTALNAAGIPSILLIDFTYPPFHTTKDTIDKCSAESLATVAEAVLAYVRSL